MQPTHTDVHNDKILTNLLLAYSFTDVIWPEVAGIVPTNGRESDKFYVFDKKHALSKDASVIAPGDPAPIRGFTVSTDDYTTNEYAISTFIADRTIKNADAPLKQQLRNAAAAACMDDIQRLMEYDCAAAFFTTEVWDTDITGHASTDDATNDIQWSDPDSSTPIDNVIDGKDTIQTNAGRSPNRMVIGQQVWNELQRNPEILICLGAQERGFVTIDMLAQFLELDKVLVGKAVYNSANIGQDVSISRIWGKHALLYYYNPAPAMMSPAACYTFQAQPVQVRRWREDNSMHRKVEFVEASIIQGYEVTGTDLGYFWSGIVA